MRQGFLHHVQPRLNALGNGNFAFAGQQINSAHFAHIHTHRIGRAADFAFRQQRVIGQFLIFRGDHVIIAFGRRFDHINAHLHQKRDDFFIFIAFQHMLGQGFMDFFVSQKPLLTPTLNQFFNIILIVVIVFTLKIAHPLSPN